MNRYPIGQRMNNTKLFSIFSRKHALHHVLAHVRLPLVSPYFLHDWVEKNAAVSGSPESMHLVEEAKLFHLLPDRRPDFEHSARFTPRRNAGTAQVIVSVGGEDDKVVLRSVEYWDPCTNIWKQLACLPFAVRYTHQLFATSCPGNNAFSKIKAAFLFEFHKDSLISITLITFTLQQTWFGRQWSKQNVHGGRRVPRW